MVVAGQAHGATPRCPITSETYTLEELGYDLAGNVTIGATDFSVDKLPPGIRLFDNHGIVGVGAMTVQRMHGWKAPLNAVDAVRAIKTPGGDLLVMFAGGRSQYGMPKERWGEKVNEMLMYRSSDGGRSWKGPIFSWYVPYQSTFCSLLNPRGTKLLYGFGTEAIPAERRDKEDGPIAYRISEDDGNTWSDPIYIRPENDPSYRGISAMPVCETDAGTWIVGTHDGDWSKKEKGPLATRQYVLRSEDKGKTWRMHPSAPPDGWFLEAFNRLEEGRPLNLGGGKVLLHARTAEGRIWEIRSDDDGKTWSKPMPTPLVHPDAPPMLFKLSDGKTLIALHHNRYTPASPHFHQPDRTELWFSLSRDDGRTWSEPRFLLANAVTGQRRPNVSYVELVADAGVVHLFIPHLWQQVLHVRIQEEALGKFPTKDQIRAAGSQPAAISTKPAAVKSAAGATTYKARPQAVFDASKTGPMALVLSGNSGKLPPPLTGVQMKTQLFAELKVQGVKISSTRPPASLRSDLDIGIMLPRAGVTATRIHSWPAPQNMIDVARGCVAPNGDLLVMVAAGESAYGHSREWWHTVRNVMLVYRSKDRGVTWEKPTLAWNVPYTSSFCVPFITRDTKRIYAFGTEPVPELRYDKECAPSVYRTSDDNGKTWSGFTRIHPINEPDYVGINAMQMGATGKGTWLLGTHTKRPTLRQCVLRSVDKGATWTLITGPHDGEWFSDPAKRVSMVEGEIVTLEGAKALLFTRTGEGHVWMLRSEDDGLTWSEPVATPLVHPMAPPMVFHLGKGRLMAFHHNRANRVTRTERANIQLDRAELWVSMSPDEGRTWTEPRLLLLNLVEGERRPNLSYVDLINDNGRLHLIVPHLWHQLIDVQFDETIVPSLPTISQLREDAAARAAR